MIPSQSARLQHTDIGFEWPYLLTRVFTAAQPGEETLVSSSITTVQFYGTAVTAAVWVFGAFALTPALAIFLSQRINP